MFLSSKIKLNSTLWIIAFTSLLVGFLVYATIDRTVVVSEQLVIVPGNVTSDSWTGVENVLVNDVSDYSLYQDFSTRNSAYIDLRAFNELNGIGVPTVDSISNSQSSSSNSTSTSEQVDVSPEEVTDVENINEIDESVVPQDNPEVVPVPTVDQKPEPEQTVVPDNIEVDTTNDETVSWGVFPVANKSFALLQEIITDSVTTTSVVSSENPETITAEDEVSPEVPEVLPLDDQVEVIEPDVVTESSEVLDETPEEEVVPETLDETVTDDVEVVTSEVTEEAIPSEESTSTSGQIIPSLMDACGDDVDCKMYSTTFNDFTIPEFESGTFITSTQLRISLAAQTITHSADKPQRFVVEYTYGDDIWDTATIIDIDDEISNSINGGYFLVSLERSIQQSQLANLQVRISYQGNIHYLRRAYIEGVWLEITSSSFFEETDDSLNGVADYERDLEQPKFHTLDNTGTDIVMGDLPTFTLSYSPQEGFLRRIANSIFSENEYKVDSVRVTDSAGNVMSIPIDVVYQDDKTWTVKFLQQPQKMVPGKFKLQIAVNENDDIYTDEFEFYWGVLAVNTTKTMYYPDENVTLNLAALTDRGDTICDADLELKLVSPSNTIYEVPVEQSGSCGKNNVTDIPDYLAYFNNTDEVGEYTIQLKHVNKNGETVHRIQENFEVRDYIPYDIERTAPTRIYPPAPYTVTLDIKANRSFRGDIVERVPRGFTFAETSGAEVTTLPDATLLTWKNIELAEGDELTLSYVFDAPDISPYMYLLGPLDMDGFRELRQWQIASDALSAVAWLTGTQTEIGTNLNDLTPGAILWSTSTVDGFYFSHSTSTNPERLSVTQNGDYLVSVTLPLERNDTVNNRWARVGFEVRVNGVVVPHAIGRSGLIYNISSGGNRQNESSSHGNFLLTDLVSGDYVEVYAMGLTNYQTQPITITGQASLYVEYISPTAGVFAATATSTVASSSLNLSASALTWTETRQDSGFVHSDTVNPEDITISNPGIYLVYVNMPFESRVTAYRNVLGRVLLDGTEVRGGTFAQGTHIVTANADYYSTSHWSGVVVSTTTNQVLSVTMEQEASTGTTTVPTGFTGSIYIQELPTEDLIALSGRDLSGGTNWNVSPAQSVLFDTQIAYDSVVFTHSTTTNSDQITVNEAGDYLLVYNDALTTTAGTNNVIIDVLVNGSPVLGAQTKSHYISNGGGQRDASGALTYNLEGLTPGDVVTIETLRDANTTVVNDTADALLLLWKKKELNFRPGAATYYGTPFDNIRFASTTPHFDFSTDDPDGSSDLVYEFSISTTSDFTNAISRYSDTDSGFSNTASSTDTSPFIENNRIRFQLQVADELQNNQTYYWRVRAKDVSGSDEYGDWSTTQSLTVDITNNTPNWHQTEAGQFLSNNVIGLAGVGTGAVGVEIVQNTEALLVYGERTGTLIKYRFWDGDAWGTETNGPDINSEIYWAEAAAGITRDEYVALFLTADGDTNAMVYSASTSSWGNQNELVTDASTPARRGIGLAYENVSGDAMAVTCTIGPDPVYSIWDGVTWSATTSIDVIETNDCNWLTLAADPTSDEIMLLIQSAAGSIEALVWDGDAWGNSHILGRLSSVNTEGFSAVYEESGDQAIVVSTDAADNEFVYSTWNGTDWQINVNVPLDTANEFETGHLVRDQGTDRVGFCMVDNGSDVNVFVWDGDAWSTETQLNPLTETVTGRPVDCEFETVAGRDGNIIVPYSDNTTDHYQYFDGSSWSGELDMTDLEEFWYLQTARTGDGTILAVGMQNVGLDPLGASEFNGTSWSPSTVIEPDPADRGVGSENESFSIAAKRFSFAEGTATTNPIDFSLVSGQPSWGDLTFNTTEPVGTSVLVRLKYSNIGTCDDYIPGGTLPGNDTGFSLTDSPVDLSSLSTSTYSQVCLEATISRNGDVTPTLDDWTLSWVREPKLVQNEYRWYVNGSFLTPTDPWPLGASDVAETSPLASDEAISIDETIRLRMSLEGLGVDTPSLSETFKLQYSPGLTCSAATGWTDVADVASTTAVWRGYENSVVGDDWYDANWSRRIKITVDNTKVAEGVTDFPVYLDLADLPAGFFVAVQSDGDDIRITESDGLSEVPFELVSIDTGAETGELHFKADLASTTDSEFYIYYDNASASGYSASATYGSRNVWTNNYDLRYALDDSPVAASPQFKDSTSNNNNAVARAGMTSGDVVTGQIGQAIDLDGNDGGVFQTSLNYAGTYTASMWWNTSGDGFAISKETGADEKFGPWSSPANRFFVRVRAGGASDTTVTNPTDGTWAYIALTRDSSNKVDLYVNGAAPTRLFSNAAQTGNSLWEDFGGQTSQGFRGVLDELRFANVKRSSGWISTEYNNQANPTGFYSVSSEELISDGKSLPSTLLSSSTYPETYEEVNPTRENQNQIVVGNNAEWDFVLQNHGGDANTNYCFRMVYEDGGVLAQYRNYPRLITNAPPLVPENIAPFDNEQTASTSPWFEFAADDALSDDVSYVIEVDDNYDFSSPTISRESNANFSQFTNLSNPSERGIYTAGQIIRFIPTVSLTNNTTYYWRVQARDDNGSGAYGEWSTPSSVTIDTTTAITTWFQTTEEQFVTNDFEDAETTVSDDVRISSGFTSATTTSTAINFADVDTGNSWGELRFVDNESSGDIKYAIEYEVSNDVWALIPDGDLSGNSAGFDTSPVNLAAVSPITYPVIRIRAILTGNSTLPQLQSWSMLWGERIEPPTHLSPFANAKVDTTTPSFTFVTTDPQGDDLEYTLEIDTTSAFTSPTILVSGVDSGFSNLTTPADTPDYNSGDTIQYLVQSALTNGQTYWWRLRARDPLPGDDAYSDWSSPESFTVDTAITNSTWYQTTGEQFATNENVNIEPTATAAEITTIIREAMVVYGESTTLNPQYRIWSGSEWSDPSSALGIGALIEWAEVKAATTRSEYALGTLGNDGSVMAQIYDSNTSTWGDQITLETGIANTALRAMDVAYETTSGDLLAVSCSGTEALYAVWNGSTWSATSSISLANANNCEYVKMASDPTSDEIIAVFRNGIGGTPDYEALVWNGSSWGNSNTFGNMALSANEGIAVEYEESGNQAVVVVSNNTTAGFLYDTWNGSSWSGQLSFALQDDYEHAVLKRDEGTDKMALCAIDLDGQISQTFWNGAAWDSYTTITTTGNSRDGRPVSCEFETTAGRDGYLMIPYSDTINARYQVYATSSYSGELDITGLNLSTGAWTTQTVRTSDGMILAVFLKDSGVAPADQYLFTYWDGSAWAGQSSLSDVPSVSGTPFHESISMAAQTFPNFDSGSILSTPINFTDGDGPRWQEISWNDTTPGASSIKYRVYYESAPGVFSLIPDGALAGNSTGFTSSPLDISALDTVTYGVIKLEAELVCDSGDCPSVEDWSVEWSEGIIISGSAFEYDQVTPLASGTVAVAINGVLQVGKTAEIASGVATQKAVFNTVGTSTFTVPAGVSEVTVKAWGAGGGGGAGGSSNAGASGGGGGYTEATFAVTPAEDLTVRIGGAGQAGETGSPAGAGGGGGYSALYRTSTPLMIAGAGGGGGAGAGGISYAGVGTACAVSAAACTPTVPSGGYDNDVLVAVVHSRTDTAHTCLTNCTGWTEFSTQAGTNGRLSVWYLRRGPSTPPDPTFTGPATDSYTARIWSFRGVARTGNPYDVVSANTTQSATNPFVGSSITSTEKNVMSVFVGGTMDNNTWGPSGGSCTVPSGVDANFYSDNAAGNDNSVFLCFNDQPTNSVGPLAVPTMTQASLGNDAGRWFTFALRPDQTALTSAGSGGVGGGVTGGAGVASGSSIGGGGGTQIAGGSAGGGSAAAGGSLTGGAGGYGTGGGAGGAGGTHGGGAGGTGDSYTAESGGAGGGAGYFGGGGGAEAASSSVSGAGGGGGSSYIDAAATATSTASGSGTTPGNNGDTDYSSGVAVGGNGGATTTDGLDGGIGRVVVSWLATTTPGQWSISNVNVSPGDVVTVFIDGASSTGKAIGVTKYDGVGDITGMELNERHLTIGSNDNATTTNANLALYDNSDDSDLFFSVNGSNVLTLCATADCSDARLKIKASNYYQPGANGTVNNFQNYGTFLPQTNTLRVINAWQQLGTFTPDTSTIIFTATTSSPIIENSTSTLTFYNVTFGEGSGSATWPVAKPLDINGTLTVNYGTLARGTSTINVAGNLALGASGYITGLATTTFDGTGSNTWSDAKASASSTNVGYVVVDGTAKTVTLSGNVGAESVTIGSDDTLNASGSGYNINVVRNWTNLNSFVPQTGTVTFIGTSTGLISRGTSAFNNLSFTGVGGNWSFATSTLAINGDLTIATGTVTLPTGTTTVGRSFLNTGGTFAHNNGEVRMTSTSGGRSITQGATTFLNAFYDLVFTGTGAWTFTEAKATTTRDFRIQAGTVTLPSSTLTVGGDFNVTGSGAFAHNSGEVILLVQDSDIVKANGSSFYNVRTAAGTSGSWYSDSWNYRLPITVQATQIDATLTNFPVYVNLDDLNSSFFTNVKTDGGDIRVTASDGVTELPRELVSINTGTTEGELYFKANSISSTTDTTFYLYYGNSSATNPSATSTYGAENVWSNGYVIATHMGDLTTSTVLNSANSTKNGTKTSANNPLGVTTGKNYSAQDHSADSITITNVGAGATNITVSAWFNADNLTGSGDTATYGYSIFSAHSSGNYTWLTAGGTGGGGSVNEVRFCAFSSSATCNVSSGANISTGNWQYISASAVDGGQSNVRVNGSSVLSFTSDGGGDWNSDSTIGDLRAGRNIQFDGRLDEIRVSNVVRTPAWQDAEYRNTATSTNFYTAGGQESKRSRTFTDTNATILGNFNLDVGGDSVFPTGVLSIGGSFDNNAEFTANSGTVRFNSSAGAETIAAGNSRFATLEFNNTGGDFTIIENATATAAINLTSANQFTLQSGKTLTSLGDFTNAASSTSTTWTGSTLAILGGGTRTLNSKTHAGDNYGTLLVGSTTIAKMWNSSSTVYSFTDVTSSVYSQDHSGVDGNLYIFGNYARTTGTEYWSYATDFDGVALLASTSRQVNVRVASSSSVGLSSASLNLVGSALASTTIDAQSGAFSMNATNTTITAEYFSFAGTGVNGLGLRASTTLSTFKDGFFTVAPGQTGITISSTTVTQNPSAQFFRINFATTTTGSASNVTLTGTTSSYVWFRDGTGNLYGENFDADGANPGSVRWDDSSNSIVVSGVVYADDGITTLGAPTCDGVTNNVRIVVNSGSYASSTSCNVSTGAYSFGAVNYIGDPTMIVYLDTNGGVKGSVVTKTPSSNITNLNIYANRVITRHQDTLPLSIADMVNYDNDNDSDISFIAATSTTNTLTLLPNTELFVYATTTFAPGGNVTLLGNGNSNSYEGTLQLGEAATFTASGTETHTLAGRFVMATTSTFTAASSSFIFNATTTGKSITSPNTITFNQLEFNGLGGGWNITAPLSIEADMYVATGTVTGTSNINLQNGSLYGNGMLSLGAGTTTLSRTNTFGGNSAWTFYNLVLGNGTVVGTTTRVANATTTVSGVLTIANAHFLNAGGSVWDLSGTGNVFVRTGTFVEGTSTVRYSGAGANVISTNYYNLLISAGVGSPTYTAVGSGILVNNNLTIGGATNSTFNVNTNDPTLQVTGNVVIGSNGTLESSNSGLFSVLGNWTNTGTFNGNSGTVNFTGSSTTNISAGNSSFSNVNINGTGNFNVIANATATASFLLTNHNNFTVNSGQTLAVGGQFTNGLGGALTTWTGSTLSLFGTGTYSINASTTNDIYNNLNIGAGTQIRMWNSSANSITVNSTGSLYSQDHADVTGDLYVWGLLDRTTGNDYWSYATDFDGTNLSGGNERIANVYLASSTSATWSGASSLSVIGSSSASTTVQNQGAGTYNITFGTGATVNWNLATIRNTGMNGIVFAGTPTVTDFSRTDHLVSETAGSAITVGGTVINANPAKNFTNNIFNSGAGSTKNVTATGTAVSSWRFTNYVGDLGGEAFDSDPAGDPGYVVWDDSAALITVSGNVYSNEIGTVSSVCNGATNNIRLVVAGITTYDTTCDAGTGAYSIPNVAFSPLDTLTLYINGETPKAANVTISPISSIYDMNLYENRVVVRHENTDPITIANMAVWDSSDDADIPFTAVDSGTDTLTLPANTKLIIWAAKTFKPTGSVTLSGGGAGADYDGTLEAQTNATFQAQGSESHSIGGSLIMGTNAVWTAASSTLTMTTTGSARTFDVNANTLNSLTFTGSGSWTITDTTLTLTGSYSQSAGSVTFPTGTSTFAAAFNVTGGSFTNSGSPFVFTSTGAGNTVRFNNSTVASLRFNGSGSWNMTDTNATSTGSVNILSGGLTLPSGNFAVGGDFVKSAGTLTHNTSDLIMTSATPAVLTASSSDLYAVVFAGPATYTITDTNITFLDSFTVASGSVNLAATTTAVGGSFLATGGTFNHSSGTVLLNSSASGKTINPGSSSFYNLQIGAPSGGYTITGNATTTNNLIIANVNNLTVNSGINVSVGGVFTNSVGGAATTWTGSTLRLLGQSQYSVNTRLNSGDVYGTLILGDNVDVKTWYSSAATTTVATSSSLYSQDHANQNGYLNIYGDFTIATTTEYWNYAKDFDGTALTGVERRARVYLAPNATTTVTTGSLQIIGIDGTETLIQNQGTGTYAMMINGGTINANEYSFSNLNIRGLDLLAGSTIDDLANGYYDLAVNTGSLITLSSTTLNVNPSKIFNNIGFNATTGLSGFNINLVGETVNAWRLTGNYGNIGGEGFDIDGLDACGSIRFDDSSCLLTEQTHYRWRLDDGGEAAPNSEWYDLSWSYRQRVRIKNQDAESYATTSVKVQVTYDSNMQANFADLRFTASDGVTVVPHWIEKYTASTNAQVWVQIPSLAASDYATVFMYYGNGVASSTSSGTSTFAVFDDYEDNNISEYSGDTGLFQTDTTPVFGGTYALEALNKNGRTTDGIYRTDVTVQQGQRLRWMQYVSTAGDEACTLFGVQTPGSNNNNYAVCLERYGTNRISIAKNVSDNDASGAGVLASTTVSYSTGWYEVEVDWRTNNTIKAYLYNSAGTLVASTTASDSSYTSGGIGYTFWFQNGSWDSFAARPRVTTPPTVYFGVEQTYGGANWLTTLDSFGGGIPGSIRRLRFAIENSGLDITGQQFSLEYAAKGVAPTCESVSGVNYSAVPTQASCGSSPVCMATSTVVSNGVDTTDQLFETNGTFSAGKFVSDPSSKTSAVDVNQNYYTEVEYVLVPTINATDSYCFRVTNDGTELDFYGKVAELGLQFDPYFSGITLNDGLDISLTPGTTTAIYVTGTTTDLNGFSDLAHATATIYRSGVGASCTPDNNNCFVLSTENGKCSFTNCAGNSCNLSCVANIPFHADPTDADTYEGEEWIAYAEVEDTLAGYDFDSASGVELLTLRAMGVDSTINYGTLSVQSDTGSNNATTTITNIGNVVFDVDISGTDLTDGGSSAIPVEEQKLSTSTFSYSACVTCQQLSSTTPVTLSINLAKPVVSTPPVTTDVYWGIAVPFGINSAPHSGVNIFTPIGI